MMTTLLELAAPTAVALIVLLAPGQLIGWSLGLTGYDRLAFSAPLSLVSTLVYGTICHAMSLPAFGLAGAGVLGLVTGALTVAARWLRRTGVVESASIPPRPHRRGWLRAAPAVALLAGAAWFTVWFATAIGSADAWPQINDAIFHVGAVEYLLRHDSAWFADPARFAHGTFYPPGWHILTAMVAAGSGSSALIASHAMVLAVAAVAWPAAALGLTRRTVGTGAIVGSAVPFAALLFFAYPFQPLSWGVLWPFLLGMALVVPALTAAHALVSGPGWWRRGSAPTQWALLGASGIAAATAHPSAVYVFIILAIPLCVGALVAQRRRSEAAVVGGVLLVAGIALWSVRPESTLQAGSNRVPQPASAGVSIVLTVFSPKTVLAVILCLVAMVVVVGTLRRWGTAWIAVGVLTALTLGVVAGVDPQGPVTWVSWPWYTDVQRLRAIAVLPLVIGVALLIGGPLVTRPRSGRVAGTAVTGALAAVSVVANLQPVADLYQPNTGTTAWVTPAQQRDLRILSGSIPSRSTVAADPYTGSTWLYLVRDLTLLYPVPGIPGPPGSARDIVAARLGDMADDPAVCRAIQQTDVTYVVSGGRPHPDAFRAAGRYDGIAKVPGAIGFTEVASEGEFTLWKVQPCEARG